MDSRFRGQPLLDMDFLLTNLYQTASHGLPAGVKTLSRSVLDPKAVVDRRRMKLIAD
jgi:hypothetical protein